MNADFFGIACSDELCTVWPIMCIKTFIKSFVGFKNQYIIIRKKFNTLINNCGGTFLLTKFSNEITNCY